MTASGRLRAFKRCIICCYSENGYIVFAKNIIIFIIFFIFLVLLRFEL